MRRMRTMITEASGNAALLQVCGPGDERQMAGAFNAARGRGYDGVVAGRRDAAAGGRV